MNKTITVNIGGMNFHLDENAYEKFLAYLDSIRRSLGNTDGRDEIMQDVEARIAEMLAALIKEPNQVITLQDVEPVMATMGKPEDFSAGDTTGASSGQAYENSAGADRKLFRDPDDKVLGGVCSGVGAYFNIDTVWIRLLFAFLFFGLGTGLLFYIILWIAIPEAKSSADKLRMRGRPVNLSNIEKNVKEEMEQLKVRAERYAEYGRKNAGSVFRNIFQGIADVIQLILKVVVKLFAVFFLFIGLVVALALFAGLFGIVFHIPGVSFPLLLQSSFTGTGAFIWAMAGLALTIGIPFLLLAWAGAKLLFNLKVSRMVGFSVLGLWLVGIALLVFLGLDALKEFKVEESVRKELIISATSGKTLVLATTNDGDLEKKYGDQQDEPDWDLSLVNDRLVSNKVKLDIVKSPDGQFRLIELFFAKGSDASAARNNATQLNYSLLVQDSVLELSPTFSMDKLAKYRNQRVQLILQVPVGETIFISESMDQLLYDVENAQNIYDHDMVNRYWKMTPDGLSCLDCNGTETAVGSMPTDDDAIVRIDSTGIQVNAVNGAVISLDSTGINIRKPK